MTTQALQDHLLSGGVVAVEGFGQVELASDVTDAEYLGLPVSYTDREVLSEELAWSADCDE